MGSIKNKRVFFERNSWYHRTKTLMPDNTIKYGKKGGFKTEEEAAESERIMTEEFEKSISKTLIKNKAEVSLKEYLVYWFENLYSTRTEISTQMLGAYTLYDLILKNLEKDVKLKYVTTEFLDALIEKASKVCESAGNKARELLNIAFKDAVIDGYIKINPVTATKYYSRKKPKVVVFNMEELKTFLDLACNDNWYLEILLGLFCGLRKGEIFALQFDDFNIEENTIQINKQLVRDAKLITDTDDGYRIEDYSMRTKSPKTQNSYRNLRVPKIIIEELQIRKKFIEKQKENEKFVDNGYISCQANGKPRSLSALNTYIRKLCQRNSLPIITVHGLRHMFATILLERGVSIVKISGLLGHNSIHTTFEFYCEIMDEEEKIKTFMNNNFISKQEGV